MAPTAVAAHEIEAIVGGYHGDPFRILGPHAVKRDWSPDAWEVRAYLPHAESAEVVRTAGKTPMECLDRAGFFVARFDAQPGPYKLAIKRYDGTTVEIEDPYRFSPLLTDFQLHLHGEGTNYDGYQMLGAHVVTHEGVTGFGRR
jgi:1,4-alpha-glucan branching enzyme